MNCSECHDLLNAHVDNELDPRASLEVEGHLATCSACSAEHQALRALREATRGATYFAPPPGAEQRLGRALRRQGRGGRGLPRWAAVASAAAALLLVVGLAGVVVRPSSAERLADEVVAAHVRSLMVDHLTDVASSDQHTVKPWFQGKLPYSLNVRDWSARGFRLAGGRLDYLAETPAAALVYEHRQHKVNVFVWPAGRGGDEGVRRVSRRGYTAFRWVRDGMNYWAVSDLNQAELLDFVRLLQSEP